ncbi:isopentenyl-diphosphate delta-isomerase [Veronia nyctiphanis]|uniref:Isopentenyl-diphosphate Delta-isomerase n=1 Tax=Veronia nyctiphanis TaxID=1278244 RepID=A0A4Q0YJE8_9GAMM|nr:isopentenyl-diphosphate Delta-isomerase [Veronia nyctiphanis]RXJ70543.1 isopentenyl-diphosphate delta-isomerase [Veronia nyctiphanis]
MKSQVVLVDKSGEATGLADKMEAHKQGWLHLAFSIMVYRERSSGREYLLQRRALSKYHSGGLWTNTCCSHPMSGEPFDVAAKRRMEEELGVTQPLDYQLGDRFCYRAELDNDLIEYELDQILISEADQVNIVPVDDEIMDHRWWTEQDIDAAIADSPDVFTAWFTDVYSRVKAQLS